MIRVVAEHTPTMFAILGLTQEADCLPTYELTDTDGSPATYYRALTKPGFYVLYKRALQGWMVGFDFDTRQR